MTVPSLAYQKILVPLDGSDAAEFAITYAADLARRHGAELLLLRLAYLPAIAGAAQPGEPEEHSQETIQERLDLLRGQLRAAGLRAEAQRLTTRNVHDTLAKVVESEHVSVVVMATQGRAGMLRWVFGAQIEAALTDFPVPIMLVRPVYRKIIVPLDGSKWSESAIPRAVDIARAHNAEIVLLHAYRGGASSYADQWALAGQQQIADQPFEQMRDQLVALRNRLRQEGLQAREQLIRSNNPGQAICDFIASEEGASMVVMSTHGRTGLARWLMGSVAQTVIRNVRCPVTLVNPDGD